MRGALIGFLCTSFFAAAERSHPQATLESSDRIALHASGSFQRAEAGAEVKSSSSFAEIASSDPKSEGSKHEQAYMIPAEVKDIEDKNIRPSLPKSELLTKQHGTGAGDIKEYSMSGPTGNAAFHDYSGDGSKPLPVSDAYNVIRDKLMEKEHLLLDIGKHDRMKTYMESGHSAVTKNKEYHNSLEKYIESMFIMSGGAHHLTKKEFQDHVTLSNDLSQQLHAGDYSNDLHEMLGKKAGHVTEKSLQAQKDFYKEQHAKGHFTDEQKASVDKLEFKKGAK